MTAWYDLLKLNLLVEKLDWSKPQTVIQRLRRQEEAWNQELIDWLGRVATTTHKPPSHDEIRSALMKYSIHKRHQRASVTKCKKSTKKLSDQPKTRRQQRQITLPTDICILICGFTHADVPAWNLASINKQWNEAFSKSLHLDSAAPCRRFDLRVKMPLVFDRPQFVASNAHLWNFTMQSKRESMCHRAVIYTIFSKPSYFHFQHEPGSNYDNRIEISKANLNERPASDYKSFIMPSIERFFGVDPLAGVQMPPNTEDTDLASALARERFTNNISSLAFSCKSSFTLSGLLPFFQRLQVLTLHWQAAQRPEFDFWRKVVQHPSIKVLRLIGFENIPPKLDDFRLRFIKLETLILIRCKCTRSRLGNINSWTGLDDALRLPLVQVRKRKPIDAMTLTTTMDLRANRLNVFMDASTMKQLKFFVF